MEQNDVINIEHDVITSEYDLSCKRTPTEMNGKPDSSRSKNHSGILVDDEVWTNADALNENGSHHQCLLINTYLIVCTHEKAGTDMRTEMVWLDTLIGSNLTIVFAPFRASGSDELGRQSSRNGRRSLFSTSRSLYLVSTGALSRL